MNNSEEEKQFNEERKRRIRQFVWIGYSRANEILSDIKVIHEYPVQDKMENLMLIGEPGSGKTMILKRFLKMNPSFTDAETGERRIPVLYIVAPHNPDENMFLGRIITAMYGPIAVNERFETRMARASYLLKKAKVQLIMIDEIHSILTGTMHKQRSFLHLLKDMTNSLLIPIVICGTRDAEYAINTDQNLMTRFSKIELRRWTDNDDFLRLLASIEKRLPLEKESHLQSERIANKILSMSGGILGEIFRIIHASTTYAIDSGSEQITVDVLNNIIKDNKYTPRKRI